MLPVDWPMHYIFLVTLGMKDPIFNYVAMMMFFKGGLALRADTLIPHPRQIGRVNCI